MAKFTFSMESDDFHEVVAFINAANGQSIPRVQTPKPEATEAVEVSEDQPAPKPTQTRQRKAKEGNGETSALGANGTGSPTATEADAQQGQEIQTEVGLDFSKGEQHELLAEVTLQTIKDKASEVLGKDPRNGAAVMAKLKERFGVPAFGQLAAEDYSRCFAMLEEF